MPSTDAKHAMTAPETAAVFITLLTLYINGQKVLSICDDTQSVTSNNEGFIPWGFRAILPNQTADVASACSLQIDNVDLAITRIIKQSINQRITAQVKVVLATSPDVTEQGPYDFVLRNIKINAKTITGELHDDYMGDKKFTVLTYSPKDFPGMFY